VAKNPANSIAAHTIEKNAVYPGKWHGKKYYFGLHFDLHAKETDFELGTRCSPEELRPQLELMNPDWVQADAKGHTGHCSWFSETPGALVPPKMEMDQLRQWRETTKQMGKPLHCHYCATMDHGTAAKFPEWTVVPSPKSQKVEEGQNRSSNARAKICYRSPYLEQIMLPQLKELIDRYDVDGFWVDGEICFAETCYCERCLKAFKEETGISEPPQDGGDPGWARWVDFHHRGFQEYVTKYCDAIHAHKPGVLVCSNWMQSLNDPGAPVVPIDWISGDGAARNGIDFTRCEARFMSTRGKPWDYMLWNWYGMGNMNNPATNFTTKPVQCLEQEGAVVLALGGNLQIYEQPHGIRTGQMVNWRMKRLGEVGKWVRKRQSICQGSTMFPQVAVLHSEHHVRKIWTDNNILWGCKTGPVRGAVLSLSECHYGVDIMDEWALAPVLEDFPVVVAPEQDEMSDAMISALMEYVSEGGKLLVSGAKALERFDNAFFGISDYKIEKEAKYYVSADDGNVPVFSRQWAVMELDSATPAGGVLCNHFPTDENLTDIPSVIVNMYGKGTVVYVPFGVFDYYHTLRYPLVRAFIGECAKLAAGKLAVRVTAPRCIEVFLRKQGDATVIHFVNRLNGLPDPQNHGMVDDIPAVGPVAVEVDLDKKAGHVEHVFEDSNFNCTYERTEIGVTLKAELARIHIHSAVVIN
jgi:hypothetical protein